MGEEESATARETDKKLSEIVIVRGEDRNEAVAFTLAPMVAEAFKKKGHVVHLVTVPLDRSTYGFIKGHQGFEYGNWDINHPERDTERIRKEEAEKMFYEELQLQYQNAHIFDFHNSFGDMWMVDGHMGATLLEIPAEYKPMTNSQVLAKAATIPSPNSRHYYENVTDVPQTFKKYGKEAMIDHIIELMEESMALAVKLGDKPY